MDRSDLWLPLSVEFTEEELQEQQNRRDFFYQLAVKVRDAYREDPTLDIPHIVEQIEEAEYQDVVFVLNEFGVGEDGTVSHVGQGNGHGWVPLEYREQMSAADLGEHIGWRWPDGLLHEDPYESEHV